MAKTQRQEDELTGSRRIRAVLAPLGRACAATTACILWVGLALPGLQLVPGSGAFGDQNVSISLQAALLGIDDGTLTSTPEGRAAMRALGLAVINPTGPRLRSDRAASLAVQIVESVRTGTAAATPATDGPSDRSSAGSGTEASGGGAPTTPRQPPDPAEPDEPMPPSGGGSGGGGGTPSNPPPVPAKSAQSITFMTSPSAPGVGGSYSVGASASSGLPVGFSLAPGSAGVCTISGTTVTFVGTGTCTVRASQAGNGSYLPAPLVTQSFDVVAGIAVQTISVTSTPPTGAYVGGPTYTVAATASSGLAVTFSSGSPSVCSVSGSMVSFTTAGTCVVRANQSGNASYQPAPQVQQSFTVTPTPTLLPQTITFTSTAPTNAVYLGPSYSVAATASSGLPVTFTVSGTCTLSGSTISMAGAGSCTVYADQSGNGAYLAAPQVQQAFTIAKSAQTITFPDPGPLDDDGPPVTLSATASSGLAVTYTLDPGSAGVCSLSGSTLTPIDKGNCEVSADQAGDANYLPAPQVQVRIKIKKNVPG